MRQPSRRTTPRRAVAGHFGTARAGLRRAGLRRAGLRRAAFVVAAGVLAVPVAAGQAASAAPANRAALPDTVPAWASPANASGAPAPSSRLSLQVNLKTRDQAGAERLAYAVSDPSSPRYGRYLTPAQFNARFAPTSDQVRSVEGYLRSQGLTVTGVAPGNRWINVTGTVGDVDTAFGTTLKTYRYQGRSLHAPASRPTAPTSVAGLIQGVTGLVQQPSPAQPSHVAPTDASAGAASRAATGSTGSSAGPAATPPPATACSTFWGQHSQVMPSAYGRTEFPTANCGDTPDQLQIAYGLKTPLVLGQDGRGTTVAILDAYASDTMLADANRYATDNGQPTFASGQYSEHVFTPFDLQDECGDWGTEEHIDVEAAHNLAPGAKVLYVGAKDCDTGLDDALDWIIQNKAANLVSNSWANHGEDIPIATLQREHSLFTQAAVEGIGMYFASGDWGDEVTLGNTPSAQPDYPASDPFVTAVGGTSLAVGIDSSYQWETGWGNDIDYADYTGTTAAYQAALPGGFLSGAGGGVSTLFDQPDYQAGVVPAALARTNGPDPMRVVPDVSALADPETGMAVGITVDGTYVVQTWGGTSLACPLMAGIQAVASTGRPAPIGFANPLLYSLHGSTAYHDITTPSVPIAIASIRGTWLMTMDHDTSLATAYGYDDITGVGTPNGRTFLNAERTGAAHRR
jgi:subtilase family serine protease